MTRRFVCAVSSVLLLSLAIPARAGHNADVHSDNMRLLVNFNDEETYRSGTDIAFWGELAIFGNASGPAGFRIVDISNPGSPRLVSRFLCEGPNADVSVWGDLVFVAVDTPVTSPECGAPFAGEDDVIAGMHWEGIRIVSITNPRRPKQIATVDTDCGAHNHTLLPDPDENRVLLYVMSYPLVGQGMECNYASHRKVSVIEVPLDAPKDASIVSTVDVTPAPGCHDVSVLLELDLAAAACLTESQMWDVSDPENPVIIGRVHNPAINIHHSAAFSWDGETLVLGDELDGQLVPLPSCADGGQAPVGALWFYDVSDPTTPVLRGTFKIPQEEMASGCTAHNYNVVPLGSDRDILVAGWLQGGTTVVDFTDPANPEQIGFYIPKDPVAGSADSSYWYNGSIFVNNLGARGIDVLTIAHPSLRLRDQLFLPHLNPQTQEPLSIARRARAKAGR